MSSKSFFANQDIRKCPFMRNVSEPTIFSFLSATFPDTLSCLESVPPSLKVRRILYISKNSICVVGAEAGVMKAMDLSIFEVYNAGHVVPMDQPKAVLEMLKMWTHGTNTENLDAVM